MLFRCFTAKKWTVLKLISWKYSFKRLNEENEMTRKKKQALDSLLNTGRISQSTYDVFSNEIDEAIAEIERQQKAFLEKMNTKMAELESQIRTLEMLLANFEIQHVTDEIDDEVYQHEINILSVGIETSKHELETVKEAVDQLTGVTQIPAAELVVEQDVSNQPVEDVKIEEQLQDPPVQSIEVKEPDSFQPQPEKPQDIPETAEESQTSETVEEAKSEEKHE
jgi:FlaA1/EpsC-like NDP-sugar epimerase